MNRETQSAARRRDRMSLEQASQQQADLNALPGAADRPAAQENARDFEGELQRVAAQRAPCIAASLDAVPPEVSIHVTVHLSTQGLVTRAAASSPDVPAEALDCLEEALGAHRFGGPIPPNARTIRANFALTRQ